MNPIWLAHALKDKGLKEIPGDVDNPRIVEMHSHTTLKSRDDETSWCSSACCCWLEEVGIKSPHSAAAISWEKWGQPLSDLRPGAIVVLNRYVKGRPEARHVTICVSEKGDTFTGLGGNQSNMVKESIYSQAEITAIRWPSEVK